MTASRFASVRLLRLWETLRHLRAEQLRYLLIRRILRFPRRARLVSSSVWNPGFRIEDRLAPGEACWLGAGRFRFLNVERDCAAKAGDGGFTLDWRQASAPKLWRYNLHYFDWLKQPNVSSTTAIAQMRDWIASNPPVAGDGWEPYPVSLRLVNWIRFLGAQAADAIPADVLASIGTQAEWLKRSLEYHLQANHLFENAKALVLAGAALGGSEGRRIAIQSERLLMRELAEQFLPDGGHYERSPMYHAILTEGLLELAGLFNSNPELVPGTYSAALHDEVMARACAALDALAAMTQPDGDIALFNDASFGIATPASRLLAYGTQLLGHGEKAWDRWQAVSLPDTGYYAIGDAASRLMIDCGAIGPEYQPGHAHCDTLSYELTFSGLRIVVDTGNHNYEASPERAYARSTAAHNTATVDRMEQSEIWGVFRVARRARPLYAKLQQQGGKVLFSGAHDGYRRLGGEVTHHRTLEFDGHALQVEDRLEGGGEHVMHSYVHFAPGLNVRESDGALLVTDQGDVPVATMDIAPDAKWTLVPTERYPEFGQKVDAISVCMECGGKLPLKLNYRIQHITAG